MSHQVRPHSELFMNHDPIHDTTTPNAAVPQDHNATHDSRLPKPLPVRHPNLEAHPTVLKPRYRFPRLSRIPVKSSKEEEEIKTAAVQSQSSATQSVLDTFLQTEHQVISTTQRIDDLYNLASFIMPPYLAKQLAELKVMDEDAWMTKFPSDINADSKLGAVQSLLVEMGLIVARLSEMVKKEREQTDSVDCRLVLQEGLHVQFVFPIIVNHTSERAPSTAGVSSKSKVSQS